MIGFNFGSAVFICWDGAGNCDTGFSLLQEFYRETPTQVTPAKQLPSVSMFETSASVLESTSLSLTQFSPPIPPSFLSSSKIFLRTYCVQVTESAVRDTNTNKINATTTTKHFSPLWQRKLVLTNICLFPLVVSTARQYLYSPCSFFGQMTGFRLVQL